MIIFCCAQNRDESGGLTRYMDNRHLSRRMTGVSAQTEQEDQYMNAINKRTGRLLAFVLAVVLGLSGLPFGAGALEDWTQTAMTISWTDAAGMPASVQAVPVAWSTDQAFWAMLPADAFMTQLTLTISHPGHAYTYDPASGAVLLQPMDTGSAMDVTKVITIRAMENDQFMDTYNLYLSSAASEPSVATAEVSVVYRTEDGTELDRGSQTVTQGQENAVVPSSSLVSGYDLISDGVVYVTVNADGSTTPAEVSFLYRAQQEIPQETQAPVLPSVAEVSVYYMDQQGIEIASMQNVYLEDGDHQVVPMPADLPEGYELISPASVAIHVEGGVAVPDTVNFLYSLPTIAVTDTPSPTDTPVPETPEPVETEAPVYSGTVQVVYQDQQGTLVSTASRQVTSEDAAGVLPDGGEVPSGYELVPQGPVAVAVDSTGAVTPNSVTFTVKAAEPEETEIPLGASILRYAVTTDTQVRLRQAPGGSVMEQVRQGTYVWALQQVVDESGKAWTRVMYNGQIGYIDSGFVQVLSQADSDAYQASTGATPVPDEGTLATETPAPAETPVPTETPYVPAETPVPTETPYIPAATPIPTETPFVPTAAPYVPVPTALPVPYTGYLLTTEATALRSGINSVDGEILNRMDVNTMLRANLQVTDSMGRSWSLVTTLDNRNGFVLDSATRRITQEEALYYIAQFQAANATPVPTAAPTFTPVPAMATPQPAQVQGYAVTIGDDVYFRSMPSTMSDIKDVLTHGVVVYVNGQQYVDGIPWHIVHYKSTWGYIRADMLRMMSVAEENQYLSSQSTPAPTAAATPQPLNEQSLSSYGYVSARTVNFRKSASASSAKIGTLKKFAFALVLGTTNVDGKTWYQISYNNTRGYVQGDYFKQMTIPEMQAFLNSADYQQGLRNNQTADQTQNGQAGKPGQSGQTGGKTGIVSAEDQTVNVWTNPNSGLNVSYVPFNPYATIPPLESTVSPESSMMPEESPSDAPTESPEPTIAELATIAPEPMQTETQSGGGAGWLVILAILILGGGGTYGYMLYRKNQRIIAQRAAQRRSNAQRVGAEARTMAGVSQHSPRPGQPGAPMTPGSGQPRTGTYQQGVPTGTPQVRRPYVAPAPGEQPYTNAPRQGSMGTNPYTNAPRQGSTAPNPYTNTTGQESAGGNSYGTPAAPGTSATGGRTRYGAAAPRGDAYQRPVNAAPESSQPVQGMPPQGNEPATMRTSRRSAAMNQEQENTAPASSYRPSPRKVDPYRAAEGEEDSGAPQP